MASEKSPGSRCGSYVEGLAAPTPEAPAVERASAPATPAAASTPSIGLIMETLHSLEFHGWYEPWMSKPCKLGAESATTHAYPKGRAGLASVRRSLGQPAPERAPGPSLF